MPHKQQYSIGELSQICNVSKKALRFYDKIGLIASMRQDYNNYRMYTHDELLLVPVLKYYKQMGFKLDEMHGFITGQRGVYRALRKAFEDKLDELQVQQLELRRCEESVRDWLTRIKEAEMVVEQNVHEVGIKYVEPINLLFQEQAFDGKDIKSAVINLDFMNYVEKTDNAISGAVYILFTDMQKRIDGAPQPIRIMQKILRPYGGGGTVEFGGCMMASCYHIGALEKIHETYERFTSWIKKHGYTPGKDCYERYVTDYWTTSNSNYHVTELLIKVSREK